MPARSGAPADLPVPPNPMGCYERGRIIGGIGMVSGQFPFHEGELAVVGRLGQDLTTDEGRRAARLAALNVLAQIDHLLASDWQCFAGMLRLDALLVAAPGFARAAFVLDAASQVLLDMLGESGRHARTLAIVSDLPGGAPVELCATFAVVPASPAHGDT